MMFRFALCAIAGLILWGCKETTSKVLPCNEITESAVFEAKIHDTWCLEDESLKITFRAIGDGRCNVKGIVCVWAGNAALELLVEKEGSASYKDTLTTDETWKGSLAIDNYVLSLLEIRPLERNDFDVDTAAYRFDMVLEQD